MVVDTSMAQPQAAESSIIVQVSVRPPLPATQEVDANTSRRVLLPAILPELRRRTRWPRR